ncbi:hypothetical protein F2Q69_00006123 [Brassica cretica]|uniref:Uncharacterized protein n=1 Tax=Brassica cretica TaxID=69181 RepID=A0A8S9P3P3_BRACR|nr:hypothetical protein F2Q69_00006123 [Brassica cretica]
MMKQEDTFAFHESNPNVSRSLALRFQETNAYILKTGPASKSDEPLENTTREQLEGPRTVPKANLRGRQVKQGRQVLVQPS